MLGRVKAGTLKLAKRDDGLHVQITPPNTTAGHDIFESVKRGDVSGMSIGFRIMPGGERFERRGDEHVRIVTDARIIEASIVTFPAHQATDATVAQRSLRAHQEHHVGRVAWLAARLLVG